MRPLQTKLFVKKMIVKKSLLKMSKNKLSLKIISGLADYQQAHALQLETVEQRKADKINDTLLLLEHHPVITLGKNADYNGVTASEEYLA